MFLLSVPSYHQRSELADNSQFQSGVIKVQRGEERSLSVGERKGVKHLHRPDSSTSDESLKPPKFCFGVTSQGTQVNHRAEKSKYLDIRLILETLNHCEGLFIVAGHEIGTRRKDTLPQNIASQILLNVSSNLWDIGDVHEMLHD